VARSTLRIAAKVFSGETEPGWALLEATADERGTTSAADSDRTPGYRLARLVQHSVTSKPVRRFGSISHGVRGFKSLRLRT
jgi:hypothetical protein